MYQHNNTTTSTLTSLTLSGPLYVATTVFCRVSYRIITLILYYIYTCIHIHRTLMKESPLQNQPTPPPLWAQFPAKV